MNLIPKPNQITITEGTYLLPAVISLPAQFPDANEVFLERLAQIGAYTQAADGAAVSYESAPLAEESYVLSVAPAGVTVKAAGEKGYNLALVTLFQLLAEGDGCAQCCEIVDEPRFSMRSTMLDVGRHFFGVDEVKKIIEQEALLKMNYFHWHLSEDQGFRIESRKYPKLVEISPYRSLAQGDPLTDRGVANVGDTYGGYYTQAEIRDVVTYAAKRGVEIIPEIDLPGHSSAILAAYPQYTCSGEPLTVKSTFGVHDRIFCAGKEETYDFLFGLLDELLELFPCKYIHLGGDEAPKTRWHDCPLCNARMQREGLKNYEALQASFTNVLVDHLREKGRTVLLWNESAAAGNLDPDAAVQYWSEMAPGESYIVPEVAKGRKTLLSNANFFYCSDGYAELPLRATLCFEPEIKRVPISSDNVLGVEAPMWTEWQIDNEGIERQMYPRLPVVAECGWTKERSYDEFLPRLQAYLAVPALNLMKPMDWEAATVHGETAHKEIAQSIINLATMYGSMKPADENEEAAKVEAVVPDDSEKVDMATSIRSYVYDKMRAGYTDEEVDIVVNMIFAAMAGM